MARQSDRLRQRLQDVQQQIKDAERRERQAALTAVRRAAERSGLAAYVVEHEYSAAQLEHAFREILADWRRGPASDRAPAADPAPDVAADRPDVARDHKDL